MPLSGLYGQCKHCGLLFKKEPSYRLYINKLDVVDYIGDCTTHLLKEHPELDQAETIASLQQLEEQLTRQL